MDKLSTKELGSLLINKQFYNIIVEESVDSTNNVLKIKADNDEKEGMVIIAHEQSAGRGRLGRKFFSPKNSGIYLSILFRPNTEGEQATLFTTLSALAVCKAIREVASTNATIKWVNDVLIDDKKVCGILTEGKMKPSVTQMEYIIVGIGINVKEPKNGFPEDIASIASAIIKSNDDIDVKDNFNNKLVAKILDNIYFYYKEKELDEEYIRKEYIEYSNTIGKDIYIIKGDEIEEAKAIGISKNMGLIVENEKGVKTLSSGEISIRAKKTK